MSYPIYILDLGKTVVVFPLNKEDLDHCAFWEQTVHKIVADYYKVPSRKLINLPYCMKRARIVASRVLYGERKDDLLLQIIKEVVGEKLSFFHDGHEKRLKHDIVAFRRLINPCQ